MVNQSQDERSLKILIEIVSASELNSNSSTIENDETFDVSCVCTFLSSQVHRTKYVRRTTNPIWTIQTDSLFLIQATSKRLENGGGLTFELVQDEGVLLWKSDKSFGKVNVPYEKIVTGNDERMEFKLQQSDFSKEHKIQPVLALRFRHASEADVMFMKRHNASIRETLEMTNEDIALLRNNNFKENNHNIIETILTKKTIYDGNVKKFLVKPGPDQEHTKETKWLSKDEIEKACFRLSKSWIEVGSGNMGKLYIEILKCDDLPKNEVLHAIDKSHAPDAFVGIVLEDAFVQGDVIDNCGSPRWMPWSRRAFVFPISHPQSPVLIGIFDQDVVQPTHDPLGRIVIDISKFCNNTEYMLKYDLHKNPNTRTKEARGTLSIRLRVEWFDENFKLCNTKIPRYLINVEESKTFSMLRYICKGEINVQKGTLKTVYERMNELSRYSDVVFLVIDAYVRVLLWRGYIHLAISWKHGIKLVHPLSNEDAEKKKNIKNNGSKKVAIWFPVHSILFFICGIKVGENLSLIPSFICFSLVWILFTLNWRRSRHPNPWKRCESLAQVMQIIVFGSFQNDAIIHENEGRDESEEFEMLKILKAKRLHENVLKLMYAALNFKRNYMKSSADDIAIETEDKSWHLFQDKLYYIYLPLYYGCMTLRSIDGLVNWKIPKSSLFMISGIFVIGLMFLFIDWVTIVQWNIRIFFWCHGPWMKILDIMFINSIYNNDRLLRIGKKRGSGFFEKLDDLFQSKKFREMRKKTIIAQEDALKLKDMRVYRFGKYSEIVPSGNPCQFTDLPLPESYTEVYKKKQESNIAAKIHGQKLRGLIIHKS